MVAHFEARLMLVAFVLAGAAFALLWRTLRVPAASWWAVTWFAAAAATAGLRILPADDALATLVTSLCILVSSVAYVIGAAEVTGRRAPSTGLAAASVLWLISTGAVLEGHSVSGAVLSGSIHLGLQALVAVWCFRAPRHEGGGVLWLLGVVALVSGVLYFAVSPFSANGRQVLAQAVSAPAIFAAALASAFLQIVAVTGWHHRRAKARDHDVREQSIALVERERRTLAQELHDGACQTLMAGRLQLEHAAQLGVPVVASSNLSDAISCITSVINDLRNLSHNLYPSGLAILGFARAIEELVKQAESGDRQARLECQLSGRSFSAPVELAVYRIAQEALNNVAQHSRASEVQVAVRARDGFVHLTVTDNGVGFNLHQAHGGMGLASMRERAEVLGGSLEISRSSAGGVTLQATIPDRPRGEPGPLE